MAHRYSDIQRPIVTYVCVCLYVCQQPLLSGHSGDHIVIRLDNVGPTCCFIFNSVFEGGVIMIYAVVGGTGRRIYNPHNDPDFTLTMIQNS